MKKLFGTKACVLIMIGGLAAQPTWAGFFDKLKKKAEALQEQVAGTTDETIEKAVGDKSHTDKVGSGPGSSASVKSANAAKANVAGPPSDGLWHGQVHPKGKGVIGYPTLDVVLAQDINLLRYEGNTTCLGELSGSGSKYQVSFVTGQGDCGTRASLTLAGDGKATLHWDDAPNTPPDQKVFVGSLQQTRKAWPDEWSVTTDQRAHFDVIGFKLGMSYEDALAHIEADPDMQHEWQAIVTANGKGTISTVEKVKKGSGSGWGFIGEKLSLQFAAQTPEEMKVKQDPKVIARRAEIDKMERERAEKIRKMRQERAEQSRRLSQSDPRAARTAGREKRPEEELPPLPKKPKLRPQGADAPLLVVDRLVTFPRNARPHVDNVTKALTKKYGTPSIRHDEGNRSHFEWVFDADGKKVADAEAGPCDRITPAGKSKKEGLVYYYGKVQAISPRCGLTLRARMNYEKDGGVYQLQLMVYDQQRLLGDEWYKTVRFNQARLAKEKAALEATKAVEAPEL